MADKHTVITVYRPPFENSWVGATWVTHINLWPDDHGHRDTCFITLTTRKPTERQIRKFKKLAKEHYRKPHVNRYVPVNRYANVEG